MQNSQPYPGFAHKAQHQGARIAPRRSRRGALMPAAVLAVLVITILLSQFASAQLRHASAARSEARAVWLAAVAADFDYYVHHKSKPDNQGERRWPEEGERDWPKTDFAYRPLTDPERRNFTNKFLRVGLALDIPSVTVEYWIFRCKDSDDVFGALRLSASDGRDAEMKATMARLARYGAERSVQNIPCDPDPNTANGYGRLILTAPLSGINPAYVLRMRRAGHPAPKFIGAGVLDLGGCERDGEPRKCNLTNVGSLIAMGDTTVIDDGEAAVENDAEDHVTRVVGSLRTQEMTGTLTSLRRNPEEQVRFDQDGAPLPYKTGHINIDGTTRAKTFTVTETLTSGELTGLLTDSTTGEQGESVLTVGGEIRTDDWVKTDTLTTDNLDARRHLTTKSLTLTDAARTSGPLTSDTLQSPAVDVDGEFTAGQVFTRDAEIDTLEITGECYGC